MISSVKLKNFQCFGGSGQTFELKPLTMIFGPNGAGKSTVQRALRLIHQSLAGGQNLLFVGDSINLISAGNVIHRTPGNDYVNAAINQHMEVDLETKITRVDESILATDKERMFSNADTYPVHKIGTAWKVNGMGVTTSITHTFESDKPGQDTYYEQARFELKRIVNDEGNLSWVLPPKSETLAFLGAIQQHLKQFRAVAEQVDDATGKLRFDWYSDLELREKIETADLDKLYQLEEEEWSIHLGISGGGEPSFGYYQHNNGWIRDGGSSVGTLLNIYFSWHWEQVRDSLKVVEYVPPLREIPNILEMMTPDYQGSRVEVSNWLEQITDGRFGYVERLAPLDGFGVETNAVSRFIVDKAHHSVPVRFQDVGVGLSQVIPILQALFNKYRDAQAVPAILMLEQPELHLHPKMQSNLMDAIIESINSGHYWQQIIIETHSESMITRLQRRVVEKAILNTDVSILYVDSSKLNDDGENIKRLHLDLAGRFTENWPESFSDLRLEDLGL